MWQSFGSPVTLFIRQCGASAFVVGSLSAIPLLLMPITLASAGLVERVGYRRMAIACWTARWIVCSTLIWVALLDFPGFAGWRVPLILIVVLLFHLLRNFGISANTPWTTAIIPPARRGLFLSRATLCANLGGVGAFLTIGTLLGSNPTLAQFAPVFVLGVIGGLGSTIFMARIAPPPPRSATRPLAAQVPSSKFLAGFKRCFARPGFVNFVVIQSFYGLAFISIPSLGLIYLREQVGIAPNSIIYFQMTGVVGAVLTSLYWGRWIDRRGTNSLQLVAFGGLCFNSLLWFSTGAAEPGLAQLILVGAVTLFSSVWIGALNMSQTHSIMMLAPEDDRVMFQNIAILMTQLSQALAPMIWGILIDLMYHSQFSLKILGFELGAYRVFFLASLFIGLIGVGFLSRVLLKSRKANLSPETI